MGLLPRRPQSLIMDNPSPIPTSGGGEAFSEPPNDEDDDCKLVSILATSILKGSNSCYTVYVPNPDDAQKQ